MQFYKNNFIFEGESIVDNFNKTEDQINQKLEQSQEVGCKLIFNT